MFIMQNLLDESVRVLTDWCTEPISYNVFRDLLIAMVPEEKRGSKMDKRIEETIACYESYVRTVGGMDHAEKLNDFRLALKSWEGLETNYSLHG
jgi:hypothetical protein